MLPGVHISWLINFDHAALAQIVGTAKCLPLTEGICLSLKAHNPDIVIVYRDYRVEYPTDAELRQDYAGYASRVMAVAPTGFDYIEIMNEMPMTDEQYDYLGAFLVGVGKEMNKRGVCMLAPGFGPGNPDLNKRQWLTVIPYLKWANENPCGLWPDGTPKYHGLTWHAAAYHPDPLPQWAWVNWSYVAGNAILANQQMNAEAGFGIDDFLGPKFVSEMGLEDGYSGVWERTSCEENRAAIKETIKVYALYPELFSGFHYWNFGSPGRWGDLTACLPGLFQ